MVFYTRRGEIALFGGPSFSSANQVAFHCGLQPLKFQRVEPDPEMPFAGTEVSASEAIGTRVILSPEKAGCVSVCKNHTASPSQGLGIKSGCAT
jgi:hypothetical protein